MAGQQQQGRDTVAYELEGKVLKVLDTRRFDSGFTLREFVVEKPDPKYPQPILLQCTQDRCSLLDDVSEGDVVNATFDLRGREYNGRYFTNLNVWRLEKKESADSGGGEYGDDENPPLPDESMAPAEDDDLPF